MGRRRTLPIVAGGGLLAAGCAERGVASGPASSPGLATWALVWGATALAILVIAALVGRGRRGQWTVAVTVLSVYAGSAVVGGAVLVGLAVASRPLADAKAAGTPIESDSLLRISTIDGDPRFFSLMLVVAVVLGSLLALLLSICARFARTDDTIERAAATAMLVLGLVPATYGFVKVLQGRPIWPEVFAALQLPILAVAIRSAWPARRAHPPSEPAGEDRSEPQPSPAG